MLVGKHLVNNWLFDPCAPLSPLLEQSGPLMGMSRLAWRCPDLSHCLSPPPPPSQQWRPFPWIMKMPLNGYDGYAYINVKWAVLPSGASYYVWHLKIAPVYVFMAYSVVMMSWTKEMSMTSVRHVYMLCLIHGTSRECRVRFPLYVHCDLMTWRSIVTLIQF